MHVDTLLQSNAAEHFGARTARRPTTRAAVAAGLIALVAAAWQVAALGVFGGFDYWAHTPEAQAHIALSLASMAAALWYAIRLRGSIDYKLSRAVFGSALVFGVYALAILGGRLVFSRLYLVSTAFETAALALATVWIRHRFSPPKVALIGPLVTGAPGAISRATVVSDPAADLRGYDILLVTLTETVSSEWARALARAMLAGCKVRHIGEYIEELRGAVSLEHFEVDHLAADGIVSYRALKRAIDVALVLFFGPVIFPALIVSALAVLIASGRPLFFVQERVGLGGRPFRMWKLRTMRPEAPGTELRPTLPGDLRVTLVGRLLRRFRLDELPQVWNVLRGEMSLIGPRPEAAPLHNEYLERLPNYAYRYLVRPGITGWAQVSAPPSATAEEARRKLTYDLFYVKRFSLFLDLQIVLRTFWIITSGGGVR